MTHSSSIASPSSTEHHCQDSADPHLGCLHDAPVTHQSNRSPSTSLKTVPDDYKVTIPVLTDQPLSCHDSAHSCPLPIDRTNSLSPEFEWNVLQLSIDGDVGVKSISVGDRNALLCTYSGEVYSWGLNDEGQVLFDGVDSIRFPIKLPIHDIFTISAGNRHCLALSSEGKLYGWGCNDDYQINMSISDAIPITEINIPYNIKEIYGGEHCSFALTQEGQVIKWGRVLPFELIKGLNDIVFLSAYLDSFVAYAENGDFFHFIFEEDSKNRYSLRRFMLKVPLTKCPSLYEAFKGSFFFDGFLFVIDFNGDIWKFNQGDDVLFNKNPSKVSGLSNIVSISGCYGIHVALDKNGKVFVWGEVSRISDVYEDSEQPICIEAFTNIEGISVGRDFLFAYNKNTVWAWGRNYNCQLGTGDLIDRPQPVKIFGSEILGSFHYPKPPLDRMFSGLIKFVYWEYLNYLVNLFGSHPYVKARFYTKCGISRRVAQFAQEVINDHPIQNQMLLKDPQDLNLNEIICDLQLRLSTNYYGPRVINTRIKKLDVYFDEVDYDPELLSFFPNVEVVKLDGRTFCPRRFVINLAHMTNLKCLQFDYPFVIEILPTSLVKLVFDSFGTWVDDLSYLTSLEHLVVYARYPAPFESILLEGQLALPQTIVRLEVELHKIGNIEIQLPNLKELLIHGMVPTIITEQNFPSLKFVYLINPDEDSLSDSTLSPTKLINHGLIKSVKLIKNEYLVELSCFPWCIQYSTARFLIDIFSEYLD
ncbi:hypothetical protein P9112_006042 [Eukaryota sp. TZLM1-RC]